jgi:hypothetical protein
MLKPGKIPPAGRNDKTICHLDGRRDLTCLNPVRFLPLVGMTKPYVISTVGEILDMPKPKPSKIPPSGRNNSMLVGMTIAGRNARSNVFK